MAKSVFILFLASLYIDYLFLPHFLYDSDAEVYGKSFWLIAIFIFMIIFVLKYNDKKYQHGTKNIKEILVISISTIFLGIGVVCGPCLLIHDLYREYESKACQEVVLDLEIDSVNLLSIARSSVSVSYDHEIVSLPFDSEEMVEMDKAKSTKGFLLEIKGRKCDHYIRLTDWYIVQSK